MENLKGIFITGTDTDAGKSVISAGILYSLRHHYNINALPVKPLQTGITIDKFGNRSIPDLDYSLQVSHLDISTEEKAILAPYCFEPACSPHLAAELANTEINLPDLVEKIHQIEKSSDFLVTEGAGGLFVPINQKETNLDLISKLNYPVIIVVKNSLGCINHALLTIKILQESQIPILGFICNRVQDATDETAYILENNPKTIALFSKIPYLGEVPNLKKNEEGIIAWTTAEQDCPKLFEQIFNK